MKEISDDFKNIMEDLEKNIKNPEDLEYIKSKFSDIFLEVLNNMASKIEDLEKRQENLEDSMNRIEKELFIEDDEDFTFEIVCPYCNAEFEADIENDLTEVKCPECGNKIELDWNETEEGGCPGSCAGCSGCEVENEEDDDM